MLDLDQSIEIVKGNELATALYDTHLRIDND